MLVAAGSFCHALSDLSARESVLNRACVDWC
jgi:hypothetical protein